MNLMKTSVVALGMSLVGVTATAQQEGLVNVTITDVVDANNVAVVVQLPVAIAANVCGVQVAALADEVSQGDANCDAAASSIAGSDQALRAVQRQGITIPG